MDQVTWVATAWKGRVGPGNGVARMGEARHGRYTNMASGICRNCGHAQVLHGSQCTMMIPIDNRGNYRMCGCTNYVDTEDNSLLDEALDLIDERYSEAMRLLADC